MNGTSSSGRTRVVVTGLGVRSPAGNDVESAYARLLAAESTAAVAKHLVEAEPEVAVEMACLVPEFDIEPYITRRERRQLDRAAELLLCAAVDAVSDAGELALADLPSARVGVQVGTGMGGLGTMEGTTFDHGANPMAMPVHTVPRTMANSAACRVAMRYGFRGNCATYATACASGTTAIGEAARRIRYGELDAAVAGGVDAPVTTTIVGAFAKMRALSRRCDEPDRASRPFDTDRDGFVMGEGAAVLVLERRDLALAREPGSTARSRATRPTATPSTSPRRTPRRPRRPSACGWPSRTPGSHRPTSGTSARTARRRCSTTGRRRPRSTGASRDSRRR